MMSRFVLSTIKLGKRFFYNTPIHRLKVTTTIYRKLFQLAYKPGEIVNVRYEGSDFQVPSNDITILPSMLTDNYEKLELAVLREILKPGMTFVDVGANIGIHTVTAAKAVGDAGCVFGFEPEPNNFRMLTENTRRNACTNVVLENAAVGSRPGGAPSRGGSVTGRMRTRHRQEPTASGKGVGLVSQERPLFRKAGHGHDVAGDGDQERGRGNPTL